MKSRLLLLIGFASACATTPKPAPVTSVGAAVSAPTGRAAGYDMPPKQIADVLHTPSPPTPNVNPTGDTILLVSREDYPPMSRVTEPFLKLAGLRVEPRTRHKHDTAGGYGVTPCARDYTLVDVKSGTERKVTLPDGCVGNPMWAADGKHFAFDRVALTSVELWVGDLNGAVHRIGDVALNPMTGTSTMQWLAGDRSLLVKLVPANAGPPPAATVGESGPGIQETTGEKGESSTYEARDTLTDKHSEALFDYYATSQLAVVDIEHGGVRPIGKPAIYVDVATAPDGRHVLVQRIHRPYSYVTTYERFPTDVEVWTLDGALVKTIAQLPLADRVPVHGVPTGPREFDWRASDPATLVWAEALDGGDWNVKVPQRDKIMMWSAPWSGAPTELTRLEQRYTSFVWGEKPSTALLYEYDANRHWTRVFELDVDKKSSRLLFDLSSDDRYADPGFPVLRKLPNELWVMREHNGTVYLQGQGASPDGDRPFLDRLDLQSQKTERLFHCSKDAYERFVAFDGPSDHSFITWHQTPIDPPNAFLRTIDSTAMKPITHLPDPTPALRKIKKRLVHYKRKDGMDLSFTLYTPPDYNEGQRVPTILYAYPLDYFDPSKAGQVSGSQMTFTRLSNYRLLLLAGYALIDNAAFPIVGDPKRAYDHYLDQLVDDATAAVNKAVEIGVADPERIGVTGHSHGALMTVNLLAHSDLFRAGIATSGSYNKTLTPFGFQNERRSVWTAQDVYLRASPFFFAHTLKKPLLIMHGSEDANPGTTPLQAVMLYEAVRGNGGTARLVMLPHEPHWYSALESNEQLAYEMVRWFDTYVKNANPRQK